MPTISSGLTVTGNFALLAGIHPDEVDRAGILGIYIDAIQWVEIVNTRGMSQYADGGLVATKLYISSANYIHKMSNYCEDCHYHWRKPTGERACPFQQFLLGLYPSPSAVTYWKSPCLDDGSDLGSDAHSQAG